MNDFPTKVKEKLDSIINDMSEHHWLFSKTPGHDFMRQNQGKLSFSDTMNLILTMGKGNCSDEILSYFDRDLEIMPSQSAFSQRREQIQISAFQYLFSEFTTSFPATTHSFKNHCILAADGAHIVYSTNSEILQDYNKPHLIDHKGYNHIHLNGFVDVISKTFIDVVLQDGQKPDERQALHTMLDHFDPESPESYIITADRGYESYDLIFHCESKNLKYVFRMKAPSSAHCILATFKDDLPDDEEEFDVIVRRFATSSKNMIMKEQKDVYLYMNPNKNIPHFYPLLNHHIYTLEFRVVKVKTGENCYEYLITNLPYSDFSMEDIKTIYHYRWGIEIAFRYLKHANGMLHFHSKKREFIFQEIYANLTLYNFGIFIANEAAKEKRKHTKNPDNKYLYDINISTALKESRCFLLRKPYQPKIDLIRLLLRFVHPVKTQFRKFDRHLRGISAIHFGYR